MANKAKQPEESTVHPDVAAAVEKIEEEKKQKSWFLESDTLEHMIYDEADKLVVRFHQGRAQVNAQTLKRCEEHRLWGKSFGPVGTLKRAAVNRPVEVLTR